MINNTGTSNVNFAAALSIKNLGKLTRAATNKSFKLPNMQYLRKAHPFNANLRRFAIGYNNVITDFQTKIMKDPLDLDVMLRIDDVDVMRSNIPSGPGYSLNMIAELHEKGQEGMPLIVEAYPPGGFPVDVKHGWKKKTEICVDNFRRELDEAWERIKASHIASEYVGE